MNHQDDEKTQTHVVLVKGAMVSHYRIVEKIGVGGMGEVYMAEDIELDRKVALKFLPPHLCQDEDCRKRFKREAQAAAKLSHPNIVTIHEVGEHQTRPYFVMEHIEGWSLQDVKAEELDIDRIVDIAIQLCDGLHSAHTAGVTHRDIKPSNIIIDSSGRPKLLDFGLATVKGGENFTKTGSALGTIGYMSPEQLQGENIDHRSDLFSFGVMLYELITRKSPFRSENEGATIKATIDVSPQPLRRYNRDVSDRLETIMARLLEKNVSRRYQSSAELLRDLSMLRESESSSLSEKHSLPSVAVLPFANLSGDPEQEYFCDGMAEEIINALANLEGLRVVARTSCFAFKGKNEDIRDIGQKLNVDHVLEGSVRKSGNRLRITGQLVKISDGFHLWSEKYDRDLEDIFKIQDEISAAIANNLNVTLLRHKETNKRKRQATEVDAYRLYLRGRWLFDQRTERSIRESIDCFEQVIARDPNFAPAYAALSYSYSELPQFSNFPQKEALSKARRAAEKAIELDNDLAEAHTALGVILAEYAWDWVEAEREYEKAIALNPSSSETHFWYSLLLMYLKRNDEAIRQMKEAQELDPLSLAINKYFGVVYLAAGDHEACEQTLKNLIDMAPGMTFPHAILGLQYLDRGMYTDALTQFQEEEIITAEVPSVIIAWKAIALIALDRVAEAMSILEDLLNRYSQNRASPYGIAEIYFALGDQVKGFEWLNQGVRERDYWLRYLRMDPTLKRERQDPRFKDILNRVGLE